MGDGERVRDHHLLMESTFIEDGVLEVIFIMEKEKFYCPIIKYELDEMEVFTYYSGEFMRSL